MSEYDYKVVVIRSDLEPCKKLLEEIKDSFQIARNAYATEMSLMTQTEESLYKITDEVPQTFCLAFDNERNVLGFILLEADARTMTLWTSHVYVRPEVRNMGVYKLMMKRVSKFAEDAKFNRVFSIVHNKNDVSQKAHKKVGFKKRWVGYEIPISTKNVQEKG